MYFRFNIAVKSLKRKMHGFAQENGVETSIMDDSDSQDVFGLAIPECDIDSLIDEAKTMFSLGAYHENIVNLQGISYEVDHKYDTLKQASNLYYLCIKPNITLLSNSL